MALLRSDAGGGRRGARLLGGLLPALPARHGRAAARPTIPPTCWRGSPRCRALRALPDFDHLWYAIRAVAADAGLRARGGLARASGPATLAPRGGRRRWRCSPATMDFAALHAADRARIGCGCVSAVCPDPAARCAISGRRSRRWCPKIGFPDLPDAGDARALARAPCPDWPAIAAAAVASDDEHDISLVFSAARGRAGLRRPALSGGRGAARGADRVTDRTARRSCSPMRGLPDGRAVDIDIAGGRIAGDRRAGAAVAARRRRALDCAGGLLSPSLRRRPHPSRQDAARPAVHPAPAGRDGGRADRRRKGRCAASLTFRSRSAAAGSIEQVVAFGTGALRTPCRHRHRGRPRPGCEARAARSRRRYRRSGRHADRRLSAERHPARSRHGRPARRARPATGADLVGGLDPAGIDDDVDGHLDAVFAHRRARRASASTSTCTIPARSAPSSCARSRPGRGGGPAGPGRGQPRLRARRQSTTAEFGRTAEALARAGVAIMTNAPGAGADAARAAPAGRPA